MFKTVILRLAEYGFTLGFPVLVFILAITMYPIDYNEAVILVSENGLQAIGNMPVLVVASGYEGQVTGYGIVEDVEARIEEPVYILKVSWEGEKVKVVLVNISYANNFDIRSLKGSTITFYGHKIVYEDEKMVMTRVLVTEAIDKHGIHYTCIHKSKFSEKCEEMIAKHSHMMKEKHGGKRSNG